MKVVTVQTGKGIDTLALGEAPVPQPGHGEALVRLKAATLNYRDIIFATGLLPGIPKEPELIPLSCAAGDVVAVGEGVSRVSPGDRVVPIFAQGWISGIATSSTQLGGQIDGVARQFDELGYLEAATLPCAALTAWSALTIGRATRAGDWILTHGTGGVSIAALQLAKAMGAGVIVTSSSDVKLARAHALGADVTLNYCAVPQWAEAIRTAIGGSRVTNVIDTVGVIQFDANASVMAEGGQLSAIGMLGSDFSWSRANPSVSIVPIGVGNRDQHEAMTRFIVEYRIRPVVDVVFDLDRIEAAYRCMESHQFFGKIGINLL